MSLLSERLRALRGDTSQAEMARQLEMPRQQWINYETGKNAPGAEVLTKICRVHACSSDWLLGLPSRGGSATANGNGAISAAGSNIHIEVGKSSAPGEMQSCKKCPHLKKLKALEKAFKKS